MDNSSIKTALQQYVIDGVEAIEATNYLKRIQALEDFLANNHHTIVFIGPVGVGKSSLIATAGQLLIDPTPPTNRQALRKQSVLATGSGRTTVCEVHIQRLQNTADYAHLTIVPMNHEDMKREIDEHAQDVWAAKNRPQDDTSPEDSADGQEIHRFIRNMCGYPDGTENTYQDGVRSRRTVKPFEDEVTKFADAQSFSGHMQNAANLAARTRTHWTFVGERSACLQQLQELFSKLNQGLQHDAMLPEKIILAVQDTLSGNPASLEVSWIDTRGLDGGIESRSDLHTCLQDQRALFVLCSTFNDAPNDKIKALLRTMRSNRQFHGALKRSLLLLVDTDNAASVNGAEGERELGQMLKIDECQRALRPLNLGELFDPSQQIMAFDVLQDDRLQLVNKLTRSLAQLRTRQQDSLAQFCDDAQIFLNNINDQRRGHLKTDIEERIQEAIIAHFSEIGVDSMFDAPLSAPIEGVLNSLRNTSYASRVRATCRRAGVFPSLDVYAATHFYAASKATEWLDLLLQPVWTALDQMAADASLEYGKDIIDNKRRELEQAENQVISDFAAQVKAEMQNLLLQPVKDRDTESLSYKIWQKCVGEWGQGKGFVDRVVAHLQTWAHKQVFRAHERTRARELLPSFLTNIALPQGAPEFTLRVHNLRALRKVEWSPRDICLLIGGNGAGKSTLLLCLRLLNLAFKSNLANAVRKLFGGSHHLRNWLATEDEDIGISLQIGDSLWQLTLQIGEGGVTAQGKESFTQNGQTVFERNSFGTLRFQGQVMEIGDKLALRALLERGATLPELKKFERFLLGIRLLHDPDLCGLKENGSFLKDDAHLFERGENVLTMLRSWYQDQQQQFRFDFVQEGMRDAFPHQIAKIDFKDNGTTLVARLSHPSRPEQPIPLENQPNGVLQMLILLSALASADERSVLALDEPENCLHPYALKSFVRQAKMWAKERHLTIILATHSIALLNLFSTTPEQVFVMKESDDAQSLPQRLDQLYDRDWLECFQLGELFEREELVSNGDE